MEPVAAWKALFSQKPPAKADYDSAAAVVKAAIESGEGIDEDDRSHMDAETIQRAEAFMSDASGFFAANSGDPRKEHWQKLIGNPTPAPPKPPSQPVPSPAPQQPPPPAQPKKSAAGVGQKPNATPKLAPAKTNSPPKPLPQPQPVPQRPPPSTHKTLVERDVAFRRKDKPVGNLRASLRSPFYSASYVKILHAFEGLRGSDPTRQTDARLALSAAKGFYESMRTSHCAEAARDAEKLLELIASLDRNEDQANDEGFFNAFQPLTPTNRP